MRIYKFQMLKLHYVVMLLAIIFILNSCGTINESRKVAGISKQALFLTDDKEDIQPTLFWAHYDATQRGSMLYVGSDKKVRVLAENPPDAAIQSIVKIGAELKGIEGIGDAELALETQKSIAELGKRTAAVNMLRDALYRLNELYYANQDAEVDFREKLLDKDFSLLKEYETSNNSTTKKEVDFFNLFEKVIESAKEISIQESDASQNIASSESKASIAKSEAEKEKIILLKEMFEKIKDTADADEVKKLIDNLINL